MAFFDKYYAPANLVTAIVGGIKAKEIIPVIDKYFGRIPARPKPEPLRTIEPAGGAETVVTLRDPAQPIYIEGYHKPAATDPGRARLRRHRRRADARPHLAALSPAGARQAALRRHPGRRLVPRRQVSAPVRPVRGAGARRQDRGGGRGAAARARAAEDRGHHRRGAGPLQDAGEGRPDPLARLERGPGREPRQLPDAVRRLARAVPLRRTPRRGDQGRHPQGGRRRPSSTPTARSGRSRPPRRPLAPSGASR